MIFIHMYVFFFGKKTNPTPDPPCPFSRIVWVLLYTNGNILDLLSIWTLPAELLTNSGPDHCDIGSRDWRFCDDWSSGALSLQWIMNSNIYPLSLQMPLVKSWRSLFARIVLFPLSYTQVLEIRSMKFKVTGISYFSIMHLLYFQQYLSFLKYLCDVFPACICCVKIMCFQQAFGNISAVFSYIYLM